jgi:hypothetical protein
MAYTTGEYLEKLVLPQILHELRNIKSDFLSVIPNAPAAAINKDGLAIHKVEQPIQVAWGKDTDWEDADIKRFQVKNDLIPYEYFSTTPFALDKEEVRKARTNRESKLRMMTQHAIAESWMKKGLHALAPADDTAAAMPIFESTGADDGTGRKRLLITDLIRYRTKFNLLEFPLIKPNDVHIVLNPYHVEDLLIDAKNYDGFRDIHAKTAKGEVINNYGFKFFTNQETVHYDAANEKKAEGAAVIGTDKDASIAFYPDHTVKHLANLTPHHKDMKEDTRSNPPKSETRVTGNGIITKVWEYGHGAILSGKVA